MSSLPPSARAKRNDQVNRILDYLEEEERQEELKAKQRELQERNDLLQKRKIQEAEEKANIKATKELQKKMGRALLQNIGNAKEKERQEKEAQRLQDEAADKARSPSLKKKTVAFVDTLDSPKNDVIDPEPSEASDWGDVTLARLRASKRPTLLSQSLLDKHPMKMSVVERFPTGPPTLPSSPHPGRKFVDSDDESDPAPESESSDTMAEDEDDSESIVLEQDEVDFDFQHQRQIALEYHSKRSRFGQDAAEAIMNPSYTDDTPLVRPTAIFAFRLLTEFIRSQPLIPLGNLQNQLFLSSERVVLHHLTMHQCLQHPLLSGNQLFPLPALAQSSVLSEPVHLTQMADS